LIKSIINYELTDYEISIARSGIKYYVV